MSRTIAIGDIHGCSIALESLLNVIDPQPEIFDLEFLICLDTGACDGGWLTALDVESGKVWQVNEAGEFRK